MINLKMNIVINIMINKISNLMIITMINLMIELITNHNHYEDVGVDEDDVDDHNLNTFNLIVI